MSFERLFHPDVIAIIGASADIGRIGGHPIKALKNVVGELLKDESKRDVAGMETLVNDCFKSKDYIEGRDAFMQKRKPVFTGT